MGVCERNDFTGRWVELQAEMRNGSFQSQRFECTNDNSWASFLIFKPRHILSFYFLTLVVKISLHTHTITRENTRAHTHTHTHTHNKHTTANKAIATIRCVILKAAQSVLSTRVSRLDKTTTKIFCNHLISISVKLVYNYYSWAFSEWLNPCVLNTFTTLMLDISLCF